MRSSADKTDPGYENFVPYTTKIYLDGKEVRDCETADEERGEVIVLVRGPDGGVLRDESGKSIKRKMLKGTVKIVLA